jgi:hypothetical protein
MNKRSFLKSIAALGGSAFLPSSLNLLSMYKAANAAVDYSAATVIAPAVMPQVINIFLYGGPSELSGNLSNIVDIENNSQNSYAANTAFGSRILTFDDDGDATNGFITKNGFWRGQRRTDGNNTHLDTNGAGGRAMQFMVDNDYMSVYRTLMKRADPTGSHRESILMSLKGSLDIEMSAGVGTKIAAALYQHRTQFEGTTSLADGTAINDVVNDLLLPFVSFEGDTRAFSQDPDFQIPLLFRGITLDQNFNNPYSRANNGNATALDALVSNIRTAAYDERYSGVASSFELRKFLEAKISNITAANSSPLPIITGQADADAVGVPVGTQLVYPNTQYRDRIRAAVTLALVNPSSLYITVGGGLGGWDDHNNGIDNYRNRMNDLFETLKAAMLHIKYYNDNTLNGLPRSTNDNIVINMFGDFGRRVNLNGNQGWDHGNNQNLYTFGGADIRPAGALGKVVGKTERSGEPGTNNQVTVPADGSYEFEPMAVAATVYSYFGVQNPQILTADAENIPSGVAAIDETQAGEPAEPGIPSPNYTSL